MILAGCCQAAALSGRLYVIESGVNLDAAGNPATRILLLDLASGRTIRAFPGGYKPAAVLSPDGSRLYVASKWTARLLSELVVYDTSTGTRVAEVDNPDEPETTSHYSGGGMWISPSGKWIYMRRDRQSPGRDEVYLAVFDTLRNRFIPARAYLGGGECFGVDVIPSTVDLKVYASCAHSASDLVFDESRDVVTQTSLAKPPESDPPIAVAVRTSSGGFHFLSRDAIPGRVIDPPALVPPHSAFAYFSTRAPQSTGTEFADEIVKADLDTLTPRVTVKAPEPFLNLSRSYDGSMIFAISPATSSITALDAATLAVVGTMKFSARAPCFAFPAPAE